MAEDKDLELDNLESSQEPDASPPAAAEPPDPASASASAPAPAAADSGDEDAAPASPSSRDLDAVYDIPVQVQAVLGRTTMRVSQLLKLGRGAVVELDRRVGEAIDIYVNNRLVARGEVVVVDERLGVTMTEIIKVDHT